MCCCLGVPASGRAGLRGPLSGACPRPGDRGGEQGPCGRLQAPDQQEDHRHRGHRQDQRTRQERQHSHQHLDRQGP